MIIKLFLALKTWALPIVIAYSTVLTIASLMHINGMPSFGFSFEDKIYHFIAYFLFAIVTYNYFKVKQITKAILMAAMAVITYGIVIEVLQHVLTSYRTFDVYDALANAFGVLIAIIVLKVRNKRKLNLD